MKIQRYKKTHRYMFTGLAEVVLIPAIVFLSQGCKKLIEIPPPVNTITQKQVFSNDLQATNAAASMFYYMVNTQYGFAGAGMTLFGGLSSDELALFNAENQDFLQFQQNTLSSRNPWNDALWTNAYTTIYAANAIIEGLQANAGVHDSVKNELTGEAKFVRAFTHFYLVNLYGDIPLILTTNYTNTSLNSRTAANKVYDQVETDLKDAQQLLSADFSVGHGERIIPTKWAALAMLARIYLYRKDFTNAEAAATQLIDNPIFGLATTPNDVFVTSSPEAIWQLRQNNEGDVPNLNATFEGWRFIPLDSTTQPFIVLTPALMNSFELGDTRRKDWIDSTNYGGSLNYFPKKYKLGPLDAVIGGAYTEYYMVLRLAEQFLIRAEARAMNNKLSDGVADLNAVRARANLEPTVVTSLPDILSAIAQERRIEFMAEWGHRWLDLKRTGQATAVLGPIKTNWRTEAMLFPLPLHEVTTDPNLKQNPGY